jgi:hypothetical protein
MRSDSGYGSGRSSTALTTEKMAVLAPMPSASAATVISVSSGRLAIILTPYRTSCHSVPIEISFGDSKQ